MYLHKVRTMPLHNGKQMMARRQACGATARQARNYSQKAALSQPCHTCQEWNLPADKNQHTHISVESTAYTACNSAFFEYLQATSSRQPATSVHHGRGHFGWRADETARHEPTTATGIQNDKLRVSMG